ncbi:hypothetical protein ABID21_000996 [Pseudorhizobium tarimense]|uniref:Antitoxin VbhA domain-containing protein n=1 Tax=Pseudorhizobium tarimense TaxID=1079109 RepID=A0ABV2H2X1_9HYPH|nr:hypothetical protein [Pseudorhizobium tarimense]MCJ8518110.1 hypothetical protein [Pseudorhizobium tarimense]
MTAEIRRGIVERVLARLEARGAPFERDPQFLAHIEDWVDGKIDMQELRGRYLDFARSRRVMVAQQDADDEAANP